MIGIYGTDFAGVPLAAAPEDVLKIIADRSFARRFLFDWIACHAMRPSPEPSSSNTEPNHGSRIRLLRRAIGYFLVIVGVLLVILS